MKVWCQATLTCFHDKTRVQTENEKYINRPEKFSDVIVQSYQEWQNWKIIQLYIMY